MLIPRTRGEAPTAPPVPPFFRAEQVSHLRTQEAQHLCRFRRIALGQERKTQRERLSERFRGPTALAHPAQPSVLLSRLPSSAIDSAPGLSSCPGRALAILS